MSLNFKVWLLLPFGQKVFLWVLMLLRPCKVYRRKDRIFLFLFSSSEGWERPFAAFFFVDRDEEASGVPEAGTAHAVKEETLGQKGPSGDGSAHLRKHLWVC